MEHSVFLQEFSEKLLKIASEKGYDYVLIDGVLKKGKWRTLPNHVHIFIVDGKIEAGPESTIGKKPEDLNWQEVADEEKNAPPSKMPRSEVTQKYLDELMQAQLHKRKDSRSNAVDKIMRKMAAEDEFHVIFLRGKKPSPFLEELTKMFAEFGQFPAEGEKKEQITFFNDRLSLLERLKKALPATEHKDIEPHIEHVKDLLEQYKKKPDTSAKPSKKDIDRVFNEEIDEFDGKKTKLRVKSQLTMKIIALLKTAFLSLMAALCEFIVKGTSKSDHPHNELLHSVTKEILSNINKSKRENFDKLFEKELSHG